MGKSAVQRGQWLVLSSVERGQSFADGIFYELGEAVNSQSPHYVMAVCLDGLGTDVELRSNFLGTFSLRQELKYLALAGRQDGQSRRVILCGATDIIFDHYFTDLGTEMGATGGDGANSAGQFFSSAILQQIAGGTRL